MDGEETNFIVRLYFNAARLLFLNAATCSAAMLVLVTSRHGERAAVPLSAKAGSDERVALSVGVHLAEEHLPL